MPIISIGKYLLNYFILHRYAGISLVVFRRQYIFYLRQVVVMTPLKPCDFLLCGKIILLLEFSNRILPLFRGTYPLGRAL